VQIGAEQKPVRHAGRSRRRVRLDVGRLEHRQRALAADRAALL
jgi:hypothetical protein